ncbi:unnamed protein product, partial [Darwinula stevensoni]
MKGFLFLGFLMAVSCVPMRGMKSYDNYSVLRVIPHDRESLVEMHKFELSHPELDFWKKSSMVDMPVDIMVSPGEKSRILEELHQAGFHPGVIIPNVQSLIEDQKLAPKGSRMAWDAYQSVDSIYEWLDTLPSLYPGIVSQQTIGTSYMGMDLKLVRFNKNPGQQKMAAFIDANIHAREWITSATLTWIMNELLTNPAYERILDEYDLHFFPVFNPDGLEWSQTNDRLWRKTRSDHGTTCRGVDGNRNFGFHWNEGGSSSNSCAETYHGPNSFSETETSAMAEYIESNMAEFDFKLYLNVHSYSQLVLLPWGYTNTHPSDYTDLIDVAHIMESALEERYNTQYTSGSVPDVLYIASGGTFDWTKGAAGIKYSYGIELRDRGTWGFLLPPSQIIPSGEETLDGIVALLDAIYEWLDTLQSLYPDIVTQQTIGSSYLDKDLKLIRFNKNSGQPKMAAFIDARNFLVSHADIHAREWITSAALTWIMNELLTNPTYERILDEYDLHFLPVVNPDGLEYTQTDLSMPRMLCRGSAVSTRFVLSVVAEGGSSNDKCSEVYHGPNPFSDVETIALSDYILENMPRVDFKLYLSIHSFSQLILLPWGFTETHPDDYEELVNIASGGSIDWTKGDAGIKYSYAFELRDTGFWGFLLPADQIVPSGEETLDGIVALLDAIYDWLDSLPFLYPDVVSNQTIGSSYLGKDLKLVRFNKESGQPKMAAFIDASIHPREWITLAALTWIMNELLTNPAHERILDEYDLHFLPIVNPDGLEYTESIVSSCREFPSACFHFSFGSVDRLWRKTVSYYGSPFGCIGADANRNFDFHWNARSRDCGGQECFVRVKISCVHWFLSSAVAEGGSSEDMCSDMYHGPTPASEAETAALSDYILDNMSQFDFKLFLNLHSFAQLVLFPWSFSETHTDDYDELVRFSSSEFVNAQHHMHVSGYKCVMFLFVQMEVADILASALEERHGTEFISGTAPDTLYEVAGFLAIAVIASGTSIDWAKGVAGIKYSYGIEMRDTGVWGLLLPPDQIIPSGEETLDGLIALLDAVRERSL